MPPKLHSFFKKQQTGNSGNPYRNLEFQKFLLFEIINQLCEKLVLKDMNYQRPLFSNFYDRIRQLDPQNVPLCYN